MADFIKFSAFFVAATFLSSHAQAVEEGRAFSMDSIAKAIIEPLVDETLSANKRYVGVWVGIISGDQRYSQGFGESELGRKTPPNDATFFEIGSISKTFVGISLAMSGLDLDKNAQDFLPLEARLPTYQSSFIRLKDLVTHTAGIPSVPSDIGSAEEWLNYSPASAYSFLAGFQLLNAPGIGYEYSNLGMGLLAHILEGANPDLQTIRFEKLVKKITEPLEMHETVVFLGSEQKERLSGAYDQNGKAGVYWEWRENSINAGAGALKSTGRDMMKFLNANLGLQSSSIDGFLKKSHEPLFTVDSHWSVAYGWNMTAFANDKIIWHNGGTSGFQTFMGFIKSQKVGVVIMANTYHQDEEQQLGSKIDSAGFKILKLLSAGEQ